MKLSIAFVFAAALVVSAFTLAPQKSKPASAETVKIGGISFDHMTLEKAKKQAKASGKLIFIDVYTTWCGPCKEMARTTFQSDAVGKLFNKKFVNLKLDAENDADGPMVSKNYSVSAYPTLLFLNAEGKLVKKLVGKQSEEKLMSIAEGL
jgi:thioredoxin 1